MDLYFDLEDVNNVQNLLSTNMSIDDDDEAFVDILKSLEESDDFMPEESQTSPNIEPLVTNEHNRYVGNFQQNEKVSAATIHNPSEMCATNSISQSFSGKCVLNNSACAIAKYRDFSNVPLHALPKQTHKNMRGRCRERFPTKLFKILENSDNGGYSHIISWLPHGRAFKIHNEKLFTERIMTSHFYMTTFDSFKRQLYIYGFQIIRKKHVDHGGYFHELFLRNRFEFCDKIPRFPKSSDDTNSSYSSSYITIVPDFYKLPPLETSKSPNSIEPLSFTKPEPATNEPKALHYKVMKSRKASLKYLTGNISAVSCRRVQGRVK